MKHLLLIIAIVSLAVLLLGVAFDSAIKSTSTEFGRKISPLIQSVEGHR
jgi:hypothetical protein